MQYFDGIKKNFGFGCMRLPMNGSEVDYDEFSKMIDAFMESGFNYFDTANGYVSGKSETSLRECLVKRYPRDSYILTDKLSTHLFDKEEEILPAFNKQLENTGVDYFDFYLMHAQSEELYEKYKRLNAYDAARKLKADGKIRHMGISFHDRAEVLDKILSENPDVEVVQIQFNYVDFDDFAVQSRKCYEVCRKHNKPVIVMEPVKGGTLVNLPDSAAEILNKLGGGSQASYAIRFAAGFDGIMMVLSGMSNMEQMIDNISFMKDFKPLDDKDLDAVHKVREILFAQDSIQCTACRYCIDGCPKKISIPDLFACMNTKKRHNDWNADYYYGDVYTVNNGKASDCVKCGKCERICPQHLEIRKLLEDVAKTFEG